MKTRSWLATAAVTAMGCALTPASPARAADVCQLEKLAELPVTMEGTQPRVHAKINGQDVTFLVDTGAFYSVISPGAAARLGLRSQSMFGLRVGGIGGTQSADVATVSQFELGGLPFRNVEFIVTNALNPGAVGLLGQNVTNGVDMEFDLGNGVLRFMKADHCSSNAAMDYWAPGSASVVTMLPKDKPGDREITAYAMVNGKRIRVLFDTGASLSGMNIRAAARAGVTPETPGAAQTAGSRGFGDRTVRTWLGPFQSFAIGSEEIRNTRLRFGEAQLGENDMLLGADFFLSHRIYFSQQQRKIYFTYNGGPVFRLDENQAARATQTAAVEPDAKAALPGAPSNTPSDAEGFARRASASMGRRDWPRAIEDLGQAIALQPDDADHYFRRAEARIQNRQPVLAMADLDEGLRRRPGDVPSLVQRAALYIGAGDRERGKADLDAAAKLKADPAFGLRIATLYQSAGFWDVSIAVLDGWVKDNPKDDQLAEGLNARCWGRAVARRELDLALKDCNQAIRMRPGSAGYLDSRGLTHLRMGDYDLAIADYDEAVRLQPRQAMSLYARGVAKAKKGSSAEGQADKQAALALNARVADQARRYGVDADGPPTP
jgi:predicted aspartyl protease/Flp pilus assembly protein TadD